MLERYFHIRSIRGKLTAVIMTVSAVVLLLVTVVFLVEDALVSRIMILRELRTLAAIIGRNTTAAITFGDQQSAEHTLTALSERQHIEASYVVMTDGGVFAKYLPPTEVGKRRPLYPDDDPQFRKANLALLKEFEQESGKWWEWDTDLEVVEPIRLEGDLIGFIVIQSDLDELYLRLKWSLVLVCAMMVIALGVALLLSRRMHRPISGPILDLAKTMHMVSQEKDYSVRAEKKSGDEVGQLIDGFNEMLEQIQKRDDDIERTATELKQSNDDIKGFIYSAAHDLRQPLVNIKGFSDEIVSTLNEIQTILRNNPAELPGSEREKISALFHNDIREASTFIGSSVTRMNSLISALMKLSQIGYRELRTEPIDMKALTQSVLRGLEHQIREKGATVVAGDLPDVKADRMAIEQIVSNMLDNAVKYLSKDRPGRIEISGEITDSEVVYHVRDNGRGIQKHDLPRLFQLFRRLGKQDLPGEGIGLAYVKALVRRQGGRIWCESEPDKGSTFSFTVLQRRSQDR